MKEADREHPTIPPHHQLVLPSTLRSLLRAPSFSLLAVLAIALGVGATTAVFSVVNGVLLQPLGYANPQQLIALYSRHPQRGEFYPPSYPDFVDWRAQTPSVAAMAFVRGETYLARGTDGAFKLTVALVSDGFFRLMDAPPLLGRTFTRDDERPGAPPVMVLSHAMWQTRFGSEPSIIGQTITTADGAFTIVGVMRESFDYPQWASAYTPLSPVAAAIPALTKRDFRVDQTVIARLAPDVSRERAESELQAVGRRLADAYPADNEGWTVMMRPLRDEIVGDVGPPLVMLSWAVGLVLLIACANVANLMLARSTARTREVALRMALGAGPWRVARHLITESLVLSAAGGVLGIAIAWAGVRLLRVASPAGIPRIDELSLDATVLGFAVAACAVSAVVVGLLPAAQAARTDVTTAMREGSTGSGRGAAGRRARAALVVAELALALVLLVGSALLIQSFARLRSVNPGFDAATLLVVPLDPPEARYGTPEEILTLYERVRDDIAALPGVRSAAIINHFPLSGAGITTPIEIPGRVSRPEEGMTAVYRLVDDRHFGTIGQRVVGGRGFTAADMTPTSTSLVVSESLADRLWPGENPVGQRLTVFRQLSASPLYRQPVAGEVVGVVADVKFRTLDEQEPVATVYVPLPVEPWRRAFVGARATGDPATLSAAARRVVTAADADLPVAEITTVNALMDMRLAERRFTMTVLSAFAASALALAIIGVYGIVAYGVAQRTREIGIRAALGAQRATLVALFVREGITLAAIGLAAGLALSFAGARLLESMLFGVTVRDVGTYVLTGVILVVVAAAASFIPARRAAGVDPMEALRGE